MRAVRAVVPGTTCSLVPQAQTFPEASTARVKPSPADTPTMFSRMPPAAWPTATAAPLAPVTLSRSKTWPQFGHSRAWPTPGAPSVLSWQRVPQAGQR